MSGLAAKSRMKKIMKLVSSDPLPEESNAEPSFLKENGHTQEDTNVLSDITNAVFSIYEQSQPDPKDLPDQISFLKNTQFETETLTMDPFLPTECNINFELEQNILPDATSPSALDFLIYTNSDQNTNQNDQALSFNKVLVDYSDSGSNNSYSLLDLDRQNKTSETDFVNSCKNLVDPFLPIFTRTQNELEIQPGTSSHFNQPEQNTSAMSHDIDSYNDSEDSWKPESASSSRDSLQQIEEETSVGKRGYRKKKPLPKRLLRRNNRYAAAGKSLQPNPCLNKKCGNACSAKFSEDDRMVIFENYWGLGNDKRQKDYLLSCAKPKSIGRKRATSNIRKISYEYFLHFNGQNIKICQQFLLKTLNISQMTLRYTIEKANKILNTTQSSRTTHTAHNKSDVINVAYVKAFIEMLPAVPSHYCRNKSTKVYLPQEFQNLSFLYKMYVNYLKEKQMESAILSKRVFRHIFKTDFNIGFHLPKKDKCIFCEKCKNLLPEAKLALEQTTEYKNHIHDKEKCKQLFLEDQKISKLPNSKTMCVRFDLQKVLNTPHGKSVTLFYTRKYAFYNESIYESGTRAGYCYLWGECQGKRGCNEIATVIFHYLNELDKKGTHFEVNLYSDSCAGQNRNRAMICMLIHFLKTAIKIKSIKVTYLLPGHTMMPVDSIHSTIESFVRNKTVWAPSEWPTMITNARSNPTGYVVKVLNHEDFKDWKTFSQALVPAKFKITFNSLRVVRLTKDNPVVTFHYGFFEDSEKYELNMDFIIRSRANKAIVQKGPSPLYHEELKTSAAKYKDLHDLVSKNVIPSRYHQQYLNMKSDIAIQDVLAETDQEDTADKNE